MKNIKIIGWYQIITGLIILGFFIINLMRQLTIWTIPFSLIIFIIDIFIIYSGYKIITEPLKGIKLSVVAQLIQAFGFTFPKLNFVFSSAGYFSIVINEHFQGINLSSNFISLNFTYDKNLDLWGIKIFIIPIIVIFILFFEGFKIEGENINSIKKNYAQQRV